MFDGPKVVKNRETVCQNGLLYKELANLVDLEGEG